MKNAIFIGKWASILGIVLGLVESLFGSQILSLIGNKNSYLLLGFITMGLSSVILYFVLYVKNRVTLNKDQKLGVILGMILPAGICFTTIGMLWYIPGTLIIIAAGGLSYEFWFSSSEQKKINKMKRISLQGLLNITGISLILCSILLGLTNVSFGLFHSHVFESNNIVTYDILPIDFIRVTNISNSIQPIIYYESITVMIVYILYIVGEVIFIFSSLTHSTLHKKVALIIILVGVIQFVVLVPRELRKIGFPITSLNVLYSSLGLGYWMILIGFIILSISTLVYNRYKLNK